GNLHGRYYWYQLEGVRDATGHFDRGFKVLDPYALATVNHTGPGIVIDRARLEAPDRSFVAPQWQDLVIAEAHVRDLTAHAPVAMSAEERQGFTGLRKWVESPSFHLARLGVNCVELQPVQEFDNRTREEYHWGYMTVNWFAPASGLSLNAAEASGIAELQALVAAFHRRGMAVILDVVYNHQGEPAHLLFIDKLYYFELDAQGELSNWSGCGNDLRTHAAMAKRLIIDSCRHLIEVFGVDGFRFDLAELLGPDVLVDIEVALKRVKRDVILIAEPWSYRGHIAGALRDTGWASWNDGYRDFLRDYVRGGSTAEAFEYFVKGSPWYWAKWPAQTINYTESHDDRAWIDVITENPHHNGQAPTAADRRRTHLMAAVLFSSIGIPMLAAGQDFMRSKGGVNNTYQRGDLNALDYRRLFRYPGTHGYFADWIAFRRSADGQLLRHWERPGEGFFRVYHAPDSTACAVVYNFDGSRGRDRLLFAVNPTTNDLTIPLGETLPAAANWEQVANHERFLHGEGLAQPVESELFLPALGCGLWIGRR
ncbi:MAG: glycoside hydrolase family 1, partial [Cephaloticoccus sp.]